ncbi:hypothetical protein MTIV3_ORF10 [Metallosphaera turreted icosahedral virus 3]|nr:hypothetical protein MTIV3_ORF10 [Metallosphaera turreted icosahedral virus 3]
MTLIVITFKIDRDTLDVLDSVAGSLKMNRSEFIRRAISHEIASYVNKDAKARVERVKL